MDRVERAGMGVAVAGHVLLFWLLSLAASAPDDPKPPPPPSMEVAFVEEAALEAAATAAEAMPQAEAPEVGPSEDAAPQPARVAEPLPAPPPVELAPPPPVPKPVAKPKAEPVKREKAPPKPEPVKAKAAAKAAAKPAPAKKVATKSAAPAGAGEKTAARGSRIGKNFLAGLSDPSPGKSEKPAAAVMSAKARTDIGAAIKRQVDPCARRQALAGSGVERIRVEISLQLNRDGSLAARPVVKGQTGVDDENSRYAARVNDLAIAAFTGCAPLKGLPADLYDVKRGWKNFTLRFSLPARG